MAWKRIDTTLSRPEVMEVLGEIHRAVSNKRLAPGGEMPAVPVPHLASHQPLTEALEQRIAWQPLHKSQVPFPLPPSPSFP